MSSDPSRVVRTLFVCMGNICRSPTAEAVFRRVVADAGLAERIVTDSAGTLRYHQGNPPDPRSCEAALRRGYDLSDLRARQVVPADFAAFDYVLAMDAQNVQFLEEMCGPEFRDRVRLLLDFAPDVEDFEVPDPYHGGKAGFETVLDLVEAGAKGLLQHIREQDLSGA